MPSKTNTINIIIKAQDRFTGQFKKLQAEEREAQANVSKMASTMKSAMKLAAIAVAAAMSKIGKSSFDAFQNYDYAMARVEVLTNSLRSQVVGSMGTMEDAVKKFGETTLYNSIDVANAFGTMAMAGFNNTEIMDAASSTLGLATAGMVSIEEATSIAADTLRGFGIDASEMARVSDVLVGTFTTANVTISDLGESMKYIGPIARMVGWNIESVSAALGIMGTQGIKGSMAGMSLRMAAVRLLSPSKEASGIIKRLGLEVTTSTGKLKSLSEIIQQLAISGASTGDILKIFGTRAGSGIAALVNKGSSALKKYTEQLENTGGITEKISKKIEDSAKGKWMKFKNSMTNLAIEIGSKLAPIIMDFANSLKSDLGKDLKDLLPDLINLFKALEEIAVLFIKAMIPQIKIFASLLSGKFGSGVKWVLQLFIDYPGILTTIISLLILYKATMMSLSVVTTILKAIELATGSVTVAQWLQNIAAYANPYILLGAVIIGVLVVIGYMIYKLTKGTLDWNKVTSKWVEYLKFSLKYLNPIGLLITGIMWAINNIDFGKIWDRFLEQGSRVIGLLQTVGNFFVKLSKGDFSGALDSLKTGTHQLISSATWGAISYQSGTGLNGVPGDGLYNLHDGEIVLNPEESEKYRSGLGQSTNNTLYVSISVNGNNGPDIARNIREEIETLLNNDNRRVGLG